MVSMVSFSSPASRKGGSIASGPTSTPNLFSDSFESGDFTASEATVNNSNFSWGSRSADVVNIVSDGAKEGTYALSLDYPSTNSMAEQRFGFDAQPEIWVRYWIRVPTNYSHGVNGGATNNKFLSLWNDGYSQAGQGSTVWCGLEQAASGGGNSRIEFTSTIGGETSSIPWDTANVTAAAEDFIDVTRDRGRWMQMVVRVKNETSLGASDGIMQAYRRWAGESDFTLLYDASGMALRESGGLQYGYILGWSNGKYAADTKWLVDVFQTSTGSLL